MTTGFWWVLAAILAFGLVHSLTASHAAKRLAERAGGTLARRWYRLGYGALSVLALLPALALAALLPDRRIYAVPVPWVLLTLGVQGLALLALARSGISTDFWLFIGLRQLGEPAPLIAERPAAALVTGGLYRYVRHPLYTATLALFWATPVMTWNWLALSLGATLYILAGIYFEERKLLAEFGRAYAAYRRRTPMLLPLRLRRD